MPRFKYVLAWSCQILDDLRQDEKSGSLWVESDPIVFDISKKNFFFTIESFSLCSLVFQLEQNDLASHCVLLTQYVIWIKRQCVCSMVVPFQTPSTLQTKSVVHLWKINHFPFSYYIILQVQIKYLGCWRSKIIAILLA